MQVQSQIEEKKEKKVRTILFYQLTHTWKADESKKQYMKPMLLYRLTSLMIQKEVSSGIVVKQIGFYLTKPAPVRPQIWETKANGTTSMQGYPN